MQKTKIQWTDTTWNPVTGCTKISPGCKHCYAERHMKRFGGDFSKITLHPERLEQPLRWKKPRMIFVNSMSDLFHEDVPENFIEDVLNVIQKCPQHTFQVLTKRGNRMINFFEKDIAPENLWLGVSIANENEIEQNEAFFCCDSAKIQFISFEPLLSRIPDPDFIGIHWVIVGGESGPGYRPMNIEWVREIRDACIKHNVPFFFKQWAGLHPKNLGRELDGKVWSQMPEK